MHLLLRRADRDGHRRRDDRGNHLRELLHREHLHRHLRRRRELRHRGTHRRRHRDDRRERHRDGPDDLRRHRARDERNEQALHPGSGEEAWSRGWDGVRPDLRPDAVRREPDEVPDARRVPRSTGCYRREVPSVPDAVRRALRRWTVRPEPRGLPVPTLREQPEPDVPAVLVSER
jgi:hypothetical protein